MPKLCSLELVLHIKVLAHLLVLQMETHFDVELSEVDAVLSACYRAVDLFASLDLQGSVQVEHTLLPVRVLGVR